VIAKASSEITLQDEITRANEGCMFGQDS
jgi:hypothetical protein